MIKILSNQRWQGVKIPWLCHVCIVLRQHSRGLQSRLLSIVLVKVAHYAIIIARFWPKLCFLENAFKRLKINAWFSYSNESKTCHCFRCCLAFSKLLPIPWNVLNTTQSCTYALLSVSVLKRFPAALYLFSSNHVKEYSLNQQKGWKKKKHVTVVQLNLTISFWLWERGLDRNLTRLNKVLKLTRYN